MVGVACGKAAISVLCYRLLVVVQPCKKGAASVEATPF